MQFKAISHNFVPVRQEGRVVLARCVCCRMPRWGVYLALPRSQEFYYHGYDRAEAEKTFNFLVQKQAQLQQIQ